jgi:hypothetical protein
MQPIIFYCMRGPVVEPGSLPAIDACSVFHRSTAENEYLRFSVRKCDIDSAEILAIPAPDDEFANMMSQLEDFDRDADFDLLRSIDRMRVKSLGDQRIAVLKHTQFDP